MQAQVTQALRPADEELARALPEQRRLGIDESPTQEAGAKSWLWTYVAGLFTGFAARGTRAATVLSEFLTDAFAGAPGRGVAQGTRPRIEPALDYLAARPVQRVPPGPGGGSAGEHAGVDHHRDPDEPGVVPGGPSDEALRDDLQGGLRPPSRVDLVHAGRDAAWPAACPDHRGGHPEADGLSDARQVQPPAQRQRASAGGALGGGRRAPRRRGPAGVRGAKQGGPVVIFR